MSGPEKPREGSSELKRKLDAMSFLGVGLSFLLEVGALGFVGYWLDGRLGTGPWLLAAGIVVGMTLALWQLLRSAERFESQRRAAAAEAKERDEHAGRD